MLWIGGPPGSGKTTVATRLARRHGLRWYSGDARTWAHRDRALREGSEAARRWEALTPTQRLALPPGEALALSLHVERGPMVVDDVRSLPRSPLVVAEGSTVPPAAISTGAGDPARSVWLLPTPAFRRAQLERRELPRAARELFLLVAETIEREAREHGAPVLRLDGSEGVEATVAAVGERFAAALAEGPLAETPAARRALLREANEAIVAQVRAFFARPWADGDAETVLREFVCECGAPDCEAGVRTAVAAGASGPLLAPGHEPRDP